MQITQVKQNWPSDLLRVDITLSNICNYQCWYCWPESHAGDVKWPNFDTLTKNVSHMLDYYKEHTNKTKFDFHIMGGEVTHWKRFIDFIKYFKDRYNCIFTLTTNASKDLDWWESAYPYLDYVTISTHHEFSNTAHIRDVADFLYKKNVLVTALVLMDPKEWYKCLGIVEELKKSKKKWAIKYLEIIHDRVSYTHEQRKVLDVLRARSANIFYFLRTNKSYRSKVKVIDTDGKLYRLEDHEIIFDRLNNFENWECSLGVDWIAIKVDGTLSGICHNELYQLKDKFNIFDLDFSEKFTPTIKPAICNQFSCWCGFETNMPKQKVIPLYAN
jgi:MoaA/NifB/PqqE/SkfB family radical SAM enzyme